ncbi:MAG: hypothetical protein CVU01_02255 [Bacteroidetes bacterium HGW-Bacteroidetes-18]|nr:MAG: hypothetical protein CVU01_02255 [Bacteroidetes bacterium HGW-Bacteroidetes-18]
MKKLKLFSVLLLSGLLAVSCSDDEAISPTDDAMNVKGSETFAKNGAPSGTHYNLNIIGVQNPKTAVMEGSNGHVIFVGLGSSKNAEEFVTTRIYLYDSEISTDSDADFRVLDANGTDGEASFELPKPGYDAYVLPSDGPVMSDYSIYVRPLGKPGGWSTITTCADLVGQEALFGMLPVADQKTVINAIDGVTGAYCSVEQVGADVTLRTKGKTTFANVTAELTSIVFKIEVWIDANDNDVVDEGEVTISYVRVPIFDDMIDGEYWKYDNNGLKLLQCRFYPVGTDVSIKDDIILGW